MTLRSPRSTLLTLRANAGRCGGAQNLNTSGCYMKSEGGCGMLPPCPGCAGEGVLFLRGQPLRGSPFHALLCIGHLGLRVLFHTSPLELGRNLTLHRETMISTMMINSNPATTLVSCFEHFLTLHTVLACHSLEVWRRQVVGLQRLEVRLQISGQLQASRSD